MSSLDTFQSSIFNSYTVPYLIYACPVSSLDILWSSIFNSKELTGHPSKFNIQLLYSPLFNICMFCELTGHLVNITGNLRVLLAVPVPVPAETHTRWRGYGYLGGLPFSDPGYTRTRTRGG
jgi:hypothetical protein